MMTTTKAAHLHLLATSDATLYVELSQFLWTWALDEGKGVLDAEVAERAFRISDQPLAASWGHVVLAAKRGEKLTTTSMNVDSSG